MTKETLWAVVGRAGWDLLILGLVLLVLYAGLMAYHGEQAFQYITRIVAQEQARQQSARPAAPAPPQPTK